MNVRILTLLVMVLLASLLSSTAAGPVTTTGQGIDVEEESGVRKLSQQNPVRNAQNHRPGGLRRRRPRPRLSHKGPMPF